MKQKITLIAILLLAAFLRFYRLDLYPVSLNWDEVSHGYNAYSILHTGRDEWGIPFPAIFRAFGDYKLPVYIYATVPWVASFGLTPLAVRGTSALAGTLSVLFTYLLVKKLLHITKAKTQTSAISLLSAFLVAISPWTVFLSRVAVEANLSSFFIISGVYYLLLGIDQFQKKSPKAWGFMLSGLLLGLSLFTYNSARVFTPLLLFSLVIIFWNHWGIHVTHISWIPNRLKSYIPKYFSRSSRPTCTCHFVGIAIFLLFFTGMIYQMTMSTAGQARLSNIFIIDQGAINRINEARTTSNLPTPLPKLLHNKATYTLTESFRNYTSLLDPRFWYLRNDLNLPIWWNLNSANHSQFSIPDRGLLYLINLPLLIYGLFMLRKLPWQARALILTWLFLAPLPASPTRDNPHPLRIITMLPIFQVLTAIGALQVIKDLTISTPRSIAKPTTVFLTTLYIISLFYFLQSFWEVYTTTYRTQHAASWQSGNPQAIQYIKDHYEDYSTIYMTKYYGEPHIYTAFYFPWESYDYQENKRWEYRDASTSYAWYWVNQLGKIRFINDWEIKNLECPTTQTCLLLTTPDNVNSSWNQIDQVTNINNQTIYQIYRD